MPHRARPALGPRRLKRAWDLLGLPGRVPFSDALAGVLVALALSDGAEISADDAQRIRAEVAIWAPHRGASPVGHLIVDDVHLDLAGHARSLAQALPYPWPGRVSGPVAGLAAGTGDVHCGLGERTQACQRVPEPGGAIRGHHDDRPCGPRPLQFAADDEEGI